MENESIAKKGVGTQNLGDFWGYGRLIFRVLGENVVEVTIETAPIL